MDSKTFIKEHFQCRLDEQQCSEECHGSANLKRHCSCCTVTVTIRHQLDVPTFSIIPVQCGIEIATPEGQGTYEGITSSGIVKVFINGGIREFSYHEVMPILKLKDISLIDTLKAKLTQHVFDLTKWNYCICI